MKAGWSRQPLGSVLSILNGYAFDAKAFSFEVGQPLIRIRDLKGGNSTQTKFQGPFDQRYVVQAGSFLIGMDGEFGCFEWHGPDALLNQRVCKLHSFAAGIDPRFLFYGINKHLKEIEDNTTFTTVKHLSSKQIASIDFAFPPLDEQRRIVEVLGKALAGIAAATANAQQSLTNAHALFVSTLQNIFIKRGEAWDERPLKEVCKFVGGSQPPKAVFSQTRTDEHVRLVQIRDYKSDKHIVYIPKKLARRFCAKDDVMIGRYGPPLFQILRGIDGAYNVALMKAVPNESMISKDYLFYFLRNRDILSYIVGASARAAGQIGLTKETIEPYPIPFPSLARQALIVDQLRNVEAATKRLEMISKKKLAVLKALQQSLFHKAFAGELT